MEWRQVTREEYKQAFQQIYQDVTDLTEDVKDLIEDVKDLIKKIEHDPNLGYEKGFKECKQEIIRDQIIYPLTPLTKIPLTKIKKILLEIIEELELEEEI